MTAKQDPPYRLHKASGQGDVNLDHAAFIWANMTCPPRAKSITELSAMGRITGIHPSPDAQGPHERCALATGPFPGRGVPEDDVEAIRPYVGRHVWALVQLQLFTAAGPGDA